MSLKRLICAFAFCFSQIAFGYECDRAVSLGWEDWKPFQYEANGELTGLDVDIVTAVVENMGCKVRYLKSPWKRHLKSLEKGTIDLAASASKTPEREEYAFFSKGYREERMVLFVKKEDLAKVNGKKLSDLLNDGMKLGAQKGVFYGDGFAAVKSKYGKNIQEANSIDVNVKKLQTSRVQGFLAEDIPAVDYLRTEGIAGEIVASDIVVNSSFVHIMISKKSLSEDFVKSFDESLNKIKKSGDYKKIIDKYLK